MKIPTRKSKMDKMLDPFELDIIKNSRKAERVGETTHIFAYKNCRDIPAGLFDFDPGNNSISKNGELVKIIGIDNVDELLGKKIGMVYTHEKTMEQRKAEIKRKITERTDD